MHKPATLCGHRTVGTDRQIANVVVEPSENAAPHTQYATCKGIIDSLTSVGGVTSAENFSYDNYVMADPNGTTVNTRVRADIICTFKTDNRAKYVTIPIENVYPGSDSSYSGIPTAINSTVNAMMTNPSTGVTTSWSNWVMVSCVIRVYEIPVEE